MDADNSLLSSLVHLTSLDMQSPGIDDFYYSALTPLTNLRRLGFPNDKRLKFKDLDSIAKLTALQELNLAGCQGAAIEYGEIYRLLGLTNLRRLQLSLHDNMWEGVAAVRWPEHVCPAVVAPGGAAGVEATLPQKQPRGLCMGGWGGGRV